MSLIATITTDINAEEVEINFKARFQALPPIVQLHVLAAVRDGFAAEHARRLKEFENDLDDAFGLESH